MNTVALVLILGSSLARGAWEPNELAAPAMNRVAEALRSGVHDRLDRDIGIALGADPTCGLCGLMRAERLAQANQLGEAIALLVPLAREYPDQPQLLILTAEVSLKLYAIDGARMYAEKALMAGVEPYRGFRALILAETVGLDRERASEVVARASTRLDPAQIACLQGLFSTVDPLFGEVSEHARLCSEEHDRALLVEAAQRAVDGSSSSVASPVAQGSGRWLLAYAAFVHGDRGRARSLVGKSLRDGVGTVDEWFVQGTLRGEAGDVMGAIQAYSRGISSDPLGEAVLVEGMKVTTPQRVVDERIRLQRVMALLRVSVAAYALPEAEARALAVDAGRLLREPEVRVLCDVAIDLELDRPEDAWRGLRTVIDTANERPMKALVVKQMVERHSHSVPDWVEPYLSAQDRALLHQRRDTVARDAPAPEPAEVEAAFGEAMKAAASSRCNDAEKLLRGIETHLSPEMRPAVLQLRYSCAVVDRDLEDADAMLAEHGVDGLPAMVVFAHGQRRIREGDVEGGRALSVQACERTSGSDRTKCQWILDNAVPSTLGPVLDLHEEE